MSAVCLLERYLEDQGEGSLPAQPCSYPPPRELMFFDYNIGNSSKTERMTFLTYLSMYIGYLYHFVTIRLDNNVSSYFNITRIDFWQHQPTFWWSLLLYCTYSSLLFEPIFLESKYVLIPQLLRKLSDTPTSAGPYSRELLLETNDSGAEEGSNNAKFKGATISSYVASFLTSTCLELTFQCITHCSIHFIR